MFFLNQFLLFFKIKLLNFCKENKHSNNQSYILIMTSETSNIDLKRKCEQVDVSEPPKKREKNYTVSSKRFCRKLTISHPDFTSRKTRENTITTTIIVEFDDATFKMFEDGSEDYLHDALCVAVNRKNLFDDECGESTDFNNYYDYEVIKTEEITKPSDESKEKAEENSTNKPEVIKPDVKLFPKTLVGMWQNGFVSKQQLLPAHKQKKLNVKAAQKQKKLDAKAEARKNKKESDKNIKKEEDEEDEEDDDDDEDDESDESDEDDEDEDDDDEDEEDDIVHV